jgi:hypothetical protein
MDLAEKNSADTFFYMLLYILNKKLPSHFYHLLWSFTRDNETNIVVGVTGLRKQAERGGGDRK